MASEKEVKELETVIYEKIGKVCSLTLNRPEKHNCLSYQMLDDIDTVLDMAEADETTNVLILKARGKAFAPGSTPKGVIISRRRRRGGITAIPITS